MSSSSLLPTRFFATLLLSPQLACLRGCHYQELRKLLCSPLPQLLSAHLAHFCIYLVSVFCHITTQVDLGHRVL